MILALLACMGTFSEWFVTLAFFALFSVAFLPLAIRIFFWTSLNLRGSLFFGAAASFILSCMVSTVLISLFDLDVRFLSVVLGCIAALNSLILLYMVRADGIARNPGGDSRNDYVTEAFLILVLASMAIPLLGIGKITAKGFAYSSLFGYDFLNRVSYTIAVARGVPIENPFFSGQPLPYHIFAFSLPAIAYKALGTSANIQHVLRAYFLLLGIVFVGCLFATLDAYRFSVKTKICVGTLSLFAYSYNGLAVVIRDLLMRGGGAVENLIQQKDVLDFSSASHGVFRTLMVEPHSVLVLCVCLMLFTLHRATSDEISIKPRFLFVAILLAASLATEVFLGAIMTAWYGTMLLVRGVTDRGFRKHAVFGLSVLAAFLTFAFLLYSWMGIVKLDDGSSSLVLHPSLAFLLAAPVLMALELGPALLFAAYFLIKNMHDEGTRIEGRLALMSLLAIGFLCMFFLRHSTEAVLVLRKSVMILQIPLLLLCGMLFEHWFAGRRPGRKSIVISGILVILSLQTFVWDFRAFTAWENPNLTAYVSEEDHRACRWIIRNTSPDSVIQAWISYASNITDGEASAYSLIPELAERATAIGIWEIAWYSRTENDTPITRWEAIREDLFLGDDAHDAWQVARKYGIDYIYIGAYEKQQAPEGCQKFSQAKDMFSSVYEEDGITIYKIHAI